MPGAQTLLLSRNPEKLDEARNLIAALLTRNFGEYVFMIGSQPSSTRVYAGQAATDDDEWQGTPRTVEELETIIKETTTLVDEVGGKVRQSSDPASFHGSELDGAYRRRYCSTAGQTILGRRYYYDYHRQTLRRLLR